MREHEAGHRTDDGRVGPARGFRKVLFVLAILALNVLVVGLFYLGTVAWRSAMQVDHHRRWVGQAYRVDDRYGIFPLTGQEAFHALEHGEQVPVAFDESGFRVPVEAEGPPVHAPRILFLGGSFTHGYGVPAEETFAARTAQALGARALNAGGSGWGLSQMVLRAREEIRTLPSFFSSSVSRRAPHAALLRRALRDAARALVRRRAAAALL